MNPNTYQWSQCDTEDYDSNASPEEQTACEKPWTDEEEQAFTGHTWVQRRVLPCSDGRLFGEYLNIFNPLELRAAQQVGGSVVSRTIYRDHQEWKSVHIDDKTAERVQGWTGIGWKA